MVSLIDLHVSNRHLAGREQSPVPKTALPVPFPTAVEPSGSIKKTVTRSENPKVAKAAAYVLTTGRMLFAVLKSALLFALALGLGFVLFFFVVHLALPLAITLGVFCMLAITASVLRAFYELGKPQYLQEMSRNYDQITP